MLSCFLRPLKALIILITLTTSLLSIIFTRGSGCPSLRTFEENVAYERTSKIAKATMTFGSGEVHAEAMQTHVDHAELHGYTIFRNRQEILPNQWTKPAMLLHIILEQLSLPEEERLEWIFWHDADTLILNRHTPLELFLPPAHLAERVHLLYTDDWNGLNAGVFYIKVHTWSVWYLSAVLSYQTFHPHENLWYAEQTAFDHVMLSDQFRDSVVQCPSKWFNAYPHNRDLNQQDFWAAPSSLLVHFAGEGHRSEKMTSWIEYMKNNPQYARGDHSLDFDTEVQEFWKKYEGKDF